MTMLEQMARAMWKVRQNFMADLHPDLPHLRLEDWGDGSLPRANGIFEEAQAALTALRNLNDPMWEAMVAAMADVEMSGPSITRLDRKRLVAQAQEAWFAALLATTCESEPTDEDAAKFPQAFTR